MPTRFSPALRFPLRRRDCVLLSLSRHSLASRNYSIPLYMLDLRLWCFRFRDAAAPTPSRADFLCFCCCPFSTAFCILRFMLNFSIFYFLFIIHIFRRLGCFFGRRRNGVERERIYYHQRFFTNTIFLLGARGKWWCWAWMNFVGFSQCVSPNIVCTRTIIIIQRTKVEGSPHI